MEADLSNRVGDALERFVPGPRRGELIESEHLARYWWASGLVAGRRVLDAGSGVGYGTALLARAGAVDAVGVDVSPEAVAAAAEAHPAPSFAVGDICALPFEGGSFDVVVCFEVIEHVERQDEAIAELARVVAHDGVLAISSPNRGVYPEGNPHHLHEFTPDELRAALAPHFAHVELRRQHDWIASAVLDDAAAASDDLSPLDVATGKIVGLAPGAETYTLALASRAPLPVPAARLVLGSIDEVRDGLLAGARAKTALDDVAYLQRVEAELRADNARLLEQVDHLRAALRAIHGSLAWRLTMPLRALRRLRG